MYRPLKIPSKLVVEQYVDKEYSKVGLLMQPVRIPTNNIVFCCKDYMIVNSMGNLYKIFKGQKQGIYPDSGSDDPFTPSP